MTPEEAAAGGERRGVHRLQYQVLEGVNQGLFGDSVVAPEDEDEMLPIFGEGADGGVGELFPAVTRVRGGLYCSAVFDTAIFLFSAPPPGNTYICLIKTNVNSYFLPIN